MYKRLYVFTFVVIVSKLHSYVVSNIKFIYEKLIGNQIEKIDVALICVTDLKD